MSTYLGRHAELYDIFYADKPYEEEALFVHKCLNKYSMGPVHRLLELACGTGTHALSLEKHGYNIIAVDYSEDMLACAELKATKANSNVHFRKQDIRELDIPERPFDAVICLFDSIGYVETNESLIKVFKGVSNHLRADGLFIFEFWHAAAMLSSYDPVRVRRWSLPESTLIRLSETELDSAKQVAGVTYTVIELGSNGKYSTFTETLSNRFFLVQEMAALLSFCALKPIKWFAGFTSNEIITEQTWHVIAVARKKENFFSEG